MVRAATLVTVLVSASCVSTSSNICSDGSICPGGFVCDVDNQRCLLPEQVSLCEGLAEGEACSFESLPGECRAGACIPYFCGDGEVTGGEDCEPTQDPSEFKIDGNPVDCRNFGAYEPGGLTCTNSCLFYPGSQDEQTGCFAGPFCGDDVTNGPELCDAPENRTCVSIGFDAGNTSCNESCGFTIGDCSRFGWNPESLTDLVALAVSGTAHGDQWAVGVNGRAMQFGGAFWNSVPTGVPNDLRNAWSFAANDAWAVGSSTNSLPAVVIHWDGNLWSTVTGVPAGEYVDVWGPSANEVYVAADTGIHKFNGTSWTTLAGFTGTPFAMRGSSGNDLWVATAQGPLRHWNGSTWTDRSPAGVTVQFLDVNANNDVWAIGHLTANQTVGVIGHYTTSWQTWQTAQEHYNAVASSSHNDTWVAGVDGIMRHWDGIGWARSANIGSSPSGLTALSGLLSLGPGEVVGVSTLNLAYRYRGQAYGMFPPLGSNPFDAPENTAVWGTSVNDQYVTNVKGEIWHFDGATWSLDHSIGDGIPFKDIAGGSATDIWAVAIDGNAYHGDGAGNWTTVDVTNVGLYKVWAHSTGDVWVFDYDGAYHKVDTNWPRTPLGAGRIVSVSGSSPSNVWVVQTDPSSVWQYNGTMWIDRTPVNPTYPPIAVEAIADDDVHITAKEGYFLHWNGSSYDPEVALPVLDDLQFMAHTAADDVIAASPRDLVHWNGQAWSTVRTPVDFVPNTADYLPIVDLQAFPGRIDMLTQRFRIRTLVRTRPLVCRTSGAEGEVCDGVDNDCNNVVDDVTGGCP